MSYYIYAVYNYVCSSIILSVKFAVSCPWPEVWSQGDAPECLESAIRSFAIVCGGGEVQRGPRRFTGARLSWSNLQIARQNYHTTMAATASNIWTVYYTSQ